MVLHSSGNHEQDAAEAVLHILHLEDNAADQILVQEEFKKAGIGCEIHSISSRDELCSRLATAGFDLIISDSSLPSFDSLEALKLSRSRLPQIPFIVFSGGSVHDDRLDEVRKAATAFIPKSKIEDLVKTVKALAHPSEEAWTAETMMKRLQWPSEALGLMKLLEQDNELGVFAFDHDRIIRLWNPEMERMYGLARVDALGRPVTQVLLELGRNGEDLLVYRIVGSEPMAWTESSHVHRRSGIPVTVLTSFLPLRDQRSTPMGGIVLSRDVSTRKRMVRAGMMVENAFRSAFDGAADAILIAERSGKILCGNRKAGRMLGHPPQELLSKDLADLMDVQGKKNWTALSADLSRVGQEMVMETRLKRGENGYCDAELSVALTAPDRITVVARDITETVSGREQLRSSKELYESLAEHAHEVVFAVSQDHYVTVVNEAFTASTGWSKWIWLGRELSSLIHPDDLALWRHNLSETTAGQSRPVFRLRLRCADGRYLKGECSCSPVKQEGKVTGVWNVIRNLDEPFFPDGESAREFAMASGRMSVT